MIRENKIFEVLTQKQQQIIADAAQIKRYDKNVLLYSPGDESTYVFVVTKGSVKLGQYVSCGKVLLKDIAYDNALFGENIFVGEGKRKEFAKTMTETSVIKIPIHIFKSLVLENSKFADEVMQVVLHRLQLLEERMESFIFDKAKTRIVNFIKKIGNLRGIKIGLDEILVNHGLSHKEIACITDTSRQTVARVLKELKDDNLIHFSERRPNKILIKSELALA